MKKEGVEIIILLAVILIGTGYVFYQSESFLKIKKAPTVSLPSTPDEIIPPGCEFLSCTTPFSEGFDCDDYAYWYCQFWQDEHGPNACFQLAFQCKSVSFAHMINLVIFMDQWCIIEPQTSQMFGCTPLEGSNDPASIPSEFFQDVINSAYDYCQPLFEGDEAGLSAVQVFDGNFIPSDDPSFYGYPSGCNNFCKVFNEGFSGEGVQCPSSVQDCYGKDGVVGTSCPENNVFVCKGNNDEWVSTYCCGGTWATNFDSCPVCDTSQCNGQGNRLCKGAGGEYVARQNCCGSFGQGNYWVFGECGICSTLVGLPCTTEGNELLCIADSNNPEVTDYVCCSQQDDGSLKWKYGTCQEQCSGDANCNLPCPQNQVCKFDNLQKPDCVLCNNQQAAIN